MTHDPLCPKMPDHIVVWTKDKCQCDLIARVRADTITRMEQSVKAVRDDTLEKVRNAVKHQQHSDDCYYAEGVLCNCEIKETLRTIDSLRSQP